MVPEKDRDARIQSAHDVALELGAIEESEGSESDRRFFRGSLPVLALIALAAGLAAWKAGVEKQSSRDALHDPSRGNEPLTTRRSRRRAAGGFSAQATRVGARSCICAIWSPQVQALPAPRVLFFILGADNRRSGSQRARNCCG